jgi:hypothetical protein
MSPRAWPPDAPIATIQVVRSLGMAYIGMIANSTLSEVASDATLALADRFRRLVFADTTLARARWPERKSSHHFRKSELPATTGGFNMAV